MPHCIKINTNKTLDFLFTLMYNHNRKQDNKRTDRKEVHENDKQTWSI